MRLYLARSRKTQNKWHKVAKEEGPNRRVAMSELILEPMYRVVKSRTNETGGVFSVEELTKLYPGVGKYIGY